MLLCFYLQRWGRIPVEPTIYWLWPCDCRVIWGCSKEVCDHTRCGLIFVKYGLEKEVTVLGSKFSCKTFSRLKLCAHVMAVAKYQGPSSVQRLITPSNKPNTSSQIRPSSNAGKKLSSVSVRKGGRSSTNQTKNSSLPDTDVYEIVRGTSHIKVCNGCRTSLVGQRFVARHCCRLPFLKRDESGNLVQFTLATPGNHHFHLNKKCIRRTHERCFGHVMIAPTLNSATHSIRLALLDVWLSL